MGLPEAQDEYDSYILGICTTLREGQAMERLYQHFRWIVSECIGLDGYKHHAGQIAKRLMELLM